MSKNFPSRGPVGEKNAQQPSKAKAREAALSEKKSRGSALPLSCFGAHSSFLFTPGCDFEFRWLGNMEKDRGLKTEGV